MVHHLVRLGEPNYDPVLAIRLTHLSPVQVAVRYVLDLANGDRTDLRALSTPGRWLVWGRQAATATAAVATGGVDVRIEGMRTVVLNQTATRAVVQVWDRYWLSGAGSADGEWQGVALYTLLWVAGAWRVDVVSGQQGWRLAGGS